jgi:hypothetical protein
VGISNFATQHNNPEDLNPRGFRNMHLRV